MSTNFNKKVMGYGLTESLLNKSEFESRRGVTDEVRTKKVGLDPNLVNSLVNKLNRDIQELQEEDGSNNLPSFLNETDIRSSGFESEVDKLEFYLNPEDRKYEREGTGNRYQEKRASGLPFRGNTIDSLVYRQEESDLNSNFTRLFSSDMRQTLSQDFNWSRYPQKGPKTSSSHYHKDTYSQLSREHPNQRFDPYSIDGKEDRMRKVVDLQSSIDDHDKGFYPESKNFAPQSHPTLRNGHITQVNNKILESPSPDNNHTASFHYSSEFGSGFSLDPHNKDSSYTNFKGKDYLTSTPNEFILNSKPPTPKLSPDINSRGEFVFDSNHFDRDSHSKNHVGFNLKKNQMFTRSPSTSSVPWQMDSESFTPLKSGYTKTKSLNKYPNTVDPDAYNAIGSSNFSQSRGPEETHQRWETTKNQRLPSETTGNDGFKPHEKHNNLSSLMSEGFSIDDQSLDNDSPFVSHRSLMGLPSSQNGTKLKGSLKALRAKISRLEIDKLTSEQRIKHLEALLRRTRHVSDQPSKSSNPNTNSERVSGNRHRRNSPKNHRSDLPDHVGKQHASIDISLGDGDDLISPLNKHENQKYLRKLIAENQRIKQELELLTHQLDNIMPVILKLNLETEKSESGNPENYEKTQATARDDVAPSKSKPKTGHLDSFQTPRSETRNHHSKRNDYIPDRLESPRVSKDTLPRSNTQQNRHEPSTSKQKDPKSVSGLPSHKQDKGTQHKSTETQRPPSRILTPPQSCNTYDTLLQSKRRDKGVGNPSPSHNIAHRESPSSSLSNPSPNSSLTGDEIPTHKPPELRNGFQSPTSTLTSSEKDDQDEVETLWESFPPSRSRACNKMDPPHEPSTAPRKSKIPGLINDDPRYPPKKSLVTSSTLKEAIDLIRSRTDYDRASKILTTARSEKCIEKVPIPPNSFPLPEVTIQLIDSVVVTLQEEYHACKKRYDEYMVKLQLSKPSMNSSPTRLRRNSPQDQLIPEISAVLKEMEVKMDQIHLLQQVQGQFFRKL